MNRSGITLATRIEAGDGNLVTREHVETVTAWAADPPSDRELRALRDLNVRLFTCSPPARARRIETS